MTKRIKKDKPSLAGVPAEIQANIKEDYTPDKMDAVKAKDLLGIGVSVSENEDLARLGYSAIHLRDLMIEIVRSLLINSFKIIYGGDLRKEGYTRIFADLAHQYTPLHASKIPYFENYFAFPISCQLTRGDELDFKENRSKAIKVDPPAALEITELKYLEPDTAENQYIWARSLSHMRTIMIKKSDARILAGGRINNYKGYLPGVLEEALIALQENKPLYLSGAYGGCAAQVGAALSGGTLSFKTDAYHTGQPYKDFMVYYSSKSGGDFDVLKSAEQYFQQYGLKRLAANNGLTAEENKRLFITPHVNEILYLVFKGLRKLHSNNY